MYGTCVRRGVSSVSCPFVSDGNSSGCSDAAWDAADVEAAAEDDEDTEDAGDEGDFSTLICGWNSFVDDADEDEDDDKVVLAPLLADAFELAFEGWQDPCCPIKFTIRVAVCSRLLIKPLTGTVVIPGDALYLLIFLFFVFFLDFYLFAWVLIRKKVSPMNLHNPCTELFWAIFLSERSYFAKKSACAE